MIVDFVCDDFLQVFELGRAVQLDEAVEIVELLRVLFRELLQPLLPRWNVRQRVFLIRVHRHVIVAAYARVHELDDDILADIRNIAVAPEFEGKCLH